MPANNMVSTPTAKISQRRESEFLEGIIIDDDAYDYIAGMAKNDLRYAYNLLEVAYYSTDKKITIDHHDLSKTSIKNCIQIIDNEVYSNVKDYFKIATDNIKEMYNQVGKAKFDENGMMTKLTDENGNTRYLAFSESMVDGTLSFGEITFD